MAKDKISDYSATANSNTDIGGINIDEGCAPSGINDAIRTLMKQLKDWQSGSQDVYIHPAGSASVPSITATGDTNTGLFFPAADTVGITTGGTERARVDSSGNLGLGVTPSAWASGTYKAFQVSGGGAISGSTGQVNLSQNWVGESGADKYIATAAASSYAQALGVHKWFNAPSGTAGSAITFTQAMTLDASGNLFLGATSAGFAEKFRVYGNYSVFDNGTFTGFIGSGSSLGTGTGSDFAIRSSNAIAFLSGGATERARIDSSGNLLVGTTVTNPIVSGVVGLKYFTSVGVLQVNGNGTGSLEVGRFTSTGAMATFYYNGSAVGNISTNGTTTAYNTSSDYRLKENVQLMVGALAKVSQLKPCTYTWKSNGSAGEGFIAHELAEVCPDAVHGDKDAVDEDGNPVYQGIDTSFLVATLTAAIQELNAKFEAYKAAHP